MGQYLLCRGKFLAIPLLVVMTNVENVPNEFIDLHKITRQNA